MTLEEQFRNRLAGQLSSDKTEVDIRVAVRIAREFTLRFCTFFAENCFELFDTKTYYIRDHEHYNDAYIVEDIFYLWENKLL